jgi:hypothetical protein
MDNKILEGRKILSVSLAMAENFGGFVAGTINAKKHFLKITRTRDGIFVEGEGCSKEVLFSNIRGIDYETAEGTVVGTGTIS